MSRLKWLLSIGMLFLGVQGSVAAAVSKHYAHDYWAPFYHGKRLNYCLSNASECGNAVANHYCQILGYDKAERSTIAYNVGITSYLDKKKCCFGWECHGFKLIRCTAQTLHEPRRDYYYRSKEFALPMFQHYRVDWCYENGKQCGKHVATSFCRRMGYQKAVRYSPESNVGATRALGNQRLCFDTNCKGFESITCYR
ncbi:MAG: hypothetical protein CK424_02115 [Legionella sp.]|nr:MAG: hypothetical protein CK424_02115 [Legionella sp.]